METNSSTRSPVSSLGRPKGELSWASRHAGSGVITGPHFGCLTCLFRSVGSKPVPAKKRLQFTGALSYISGPAGHEDFEYHQVGGVL
jgi:hypothetical protein